MDFVLMSTIHARGVWVPGDGRMWSNTSPRSKITSDRASQRGPVEDPKKLPVLLLPSLLNPWRLSSQRMYLSLAVERPLHDLGRGGRSSAARRSILSIKSFVFLILAGSSCEHEQKSITPATKAACERK